jgi:hypothetical protein
MNPMRSLLATFGCISAFILAFESPAQAAGLAGPYTPEQAESVLYESLRSLLGFPVGAADNGSSKLWLAMSIVGSVVDASDQSEVNDLANFCPEPLPVIRSYRRERKLDLIYEKVVKSLTGPLRPQSQAYKDALAVLTSSPGVESPDYSAYKVYLGKYADLDSSFLKSKDPAERTVIVQNEINMTNDWKILGFKDEVEAALGTIKTEDNNFGQVAANHRVDVLAAYRRFGLAPSDVSGAFKSPASELSPSVDKWPNTDGWVHMDYSAQDTSSRYDASTSSRRGWGGLSLGFINVVGSGGDNNSSTSSVKSANNFSYQFELKRIAVRRPWFDPEVFVERTAWTWKKASNTPTYPHVAINPDGNGKPILPTDNTYDNTKIDCSLIPQELIIARNRSLTATVSKSDYQKIESSSSASGGGSLFGIFGGSSSGSWSHTKISEDTNNVTFKIDSPGIAVIGVISEQISQLPEPNLADNWGDNAWIPKP